MIARARSFVAAQPYTTYCAVVIAIWLAVWLSVFPNLYGWLTDDATVYNTIELLSRGGKNIVDIQWFHAYMWFIAGIPTLIHLSVPSQIEPRAWGRAPEFRGMILITILLHAVLLGVIAAFLRQLCANRLVCGLAFTLFAATPVFNFYADLLDSRYLGLLAGIPAIMLLLRAVDSTGTPLPSRQSAFSFFLPGFLIAVGQSIHYTELYLAGPVALVFWCLAFRAAWAMAGNALSVCAKHACLFIGGIALWIVPIQTLSLLFHPFAQSMLGTIIGQVQYHSTTFTRLETLQTWWRIFSIGMGLPMMLAALAGLVLLAFKRVRPSFVSPGNAVIIVASTLIANAYFLLSPTYPFYRQHSGYQIFYCLAASIAIWRIADALADVRVRAAAVAVLAFAVAYIPSFVRLPEVFSGQQGLGRAINLANTLVYTNDVHFISTYDWDIDPKSITTRAAFEQLPARALIVTDMPLSFRLRFPDLAAQLDATRPIASYPTLWCTQEAYAEVQAFFDFRRWYDEPDNCEARVYRVADVRRQVALQPAVVAEVRSSAPLGPAYAAAHVFDAPSTPGPLANAFFGVPANGSMWAARTSGGQAWLRVTFAHPLSLSSITVVPPDFYAPPDYKSVGRTRSLRIFAAAPAERGEHLIWSGDDLTNRDDFVATFAPATFRAVRFVVSPARSSNVAALAAIAFPGHPVVLDSRVRRVQ